MVAEVHLRIEDRFPLPHVNDHYACRRMWASVLIEVIRSAFGVTSHIAPLEMSSSRSYLLGSSRDLKMLPSLANVDAGRFFRVVQPRLKVAFEQYKRPKINRGKRGRNGGEVTLNVEIIKLIWTDPPAPRAAAPTAPSSQPDLAPQTACQPVEASAA